MVSKGNHPQMALIQVSEIWSFTQIDGWVAMISPCFMVIGRGPQAQASDLLEASADLSHVPGKLRAGDGPRVVVLVDASSGWPWIICGLFGDIWRTYLDFFGCMDYLWIIHGL
jgi:hypothetical protein